MKLVEIGYDEEKILASKEIEIENNLEYIGSFSLGVKPIDESNFILFSNRNFDFEDKGYLLRGNDNKESIYCIYNESKPLILSETKQYLDEHIRYERFKQSLKELISDDETAAFGEDDELIYQIEDINVYGGFELGIRGNDHTILKSNDVTWEEILSWGTVIVPETNSYISDDEIDDFENLGFDRLPLNDNHIIKSSSINSEELTENILSDEEKHYKNIYNFVNSKNDTLEKNVYSSYKDLYDSEIKDKVHSAFEDLYLIDLKKELGNTFDFLIKNDIVLEKIYSSVSDLEKDLDNDGVSDRIDINDNDSKVQTVADKNTKNQIEPDKKKNSEIEL